MVLWGKWRSRNLQVYPKTSYPIDTLSTICFVVPQNLLYETEIWQGIGCGDSLRKRLIPLLGLQALASVMSSHFGQKNWDCHLLTEHWGGICKFLSKLNQRTRAKRRWNEATKKVLFSKWNAIYLINALGWWPTFNEHCPWSHAEVCNEYEKQT